MAMINKTPDFFQITIRGQYTKETIAWPIVKKTEKAIAVQTPGGDIWLPLWKFGVRSYSRNQIPQFQKLLEETTKNNWNSFLRVWKSGTGRSEKSHKFSTDVLILGGEHPGTMLTKRRTFTLPISQVKQIGDEWFAPIWLLQKHLDKAESLPGSSWQGLPMVMAQLTDALTRLRTRDDDRAAELARRQEEEVAVRADIERQKAESILNLNSLIGDDGLLAVHFCKQKFSLSELAQNGCQISFWPTWSANQDVHQLQRVASLVRFARAHPLYLNWKLRNVGKIDSLPKSVQKKVRVPDRVLTNCDVDWSEWGGTATRREKLHYNESGCTVAFYGKKREITLSNGVVITKMDRPNLTIVECGNDGLQVE